MHAGQRECVYSGLPPTGLAAARKLVMPGKGELAEAGARAHQIMSVLGVTLETAVISTREADQVWMAVAGMERLGGRISHTSWVCVSRRAVF